MTATDGGVGVSVFAGVGGLEHGFEAAGIPTAVQVEWDRQARAVLAARYPDAVRFGDVREVTVDAVRAVVGDRRVRCLYGGFPCQDVSVAGRRAGMAGDRSSLYTELVRLADGLDPEWLVVENVPGLLSADVDPDANGGAECAAAGRGCAHAVRPETGSAHGYGRGSAFAVVLGDITGYQPPVPAGGWRNSGVCAGPRRSVAWRVLDARHFGVAQRRRRVFLVACAGDRAAPAAVLLEPEGVRGDPPPGEPPRPRFATRAARPAVRAGGAGADGRRARGAATADSGVTSALTSRMGTNTGPDAADAQAGFLVPPPVAADARNGALSGDVTGTLQSHGQSYSLNAQPTVIQPNDEVGALTSTGGPAALDDQATSQLVVGEPAAMRETGQGWWTEDDEAGTLRVDGDPATVVAEPTPLLEVNARTGRSTDDPECGIGIGEAGDPMFTLQAGKQHGVAYDDDPARPVGRRGRDDAGTVPELGAEPLMNALGTAGGGSSMPTVLAYEVDKERGIRNDQGVKVTETDVAPPLLADGDPAERTDRGLRVVQAAYRKSRRAADPTDDETWVEGDVANTLNTFDGGDVRASEVVVEVPVAIAAGAHTHATDDDATPALTASKEGPGAVAFSNAGYGATVDDQVAPTLQATGQEGNQVAGIIEAFPIGQDALRGGEGVAGTPSPDAEGRVRLRDPGLGVYDDGDPAATVTAAGPGAVGVTSRGDGAAWVSDHAPALQSAGGGQAGQGYAAVMDDRAAYDMQNDAIDPDVAPTLQAEAQRRQNRGAGVVGAQVRRLTPVECERLQGFPDGWTDVDGAADSVRYRQLGNAVCAAVSDWLAWRIVAYRNGWRPA